MNKGKVAGALEQAKGAAETAAGKLLGNAELENKGKVDSAAGKLRSAEGEAEDAVKDVAKSK